MDKRKIILISTAIILLLVLASILVAIFINKNGSQEISDQVYELTRTMSAGQSMTATITLAPTQRLVELEKINCTYPSQYWIYWSDDLDKLGIMISINDDQYSPNELSALITSVTDENYANLLWQLFAVHLNLQQGTDPVYILDALKEADQIFAEISLGQTVTYANDKIESIIDSLVRYNTGVFGPGLCPGAETLIEPTITPTPTFTATPMWSSTPTSSPSPSLTPTLRVTFKPNTLTPTKRPPVYSNPTNTPVPPTPAPTDTEIPPTEPPPPFP